ncbi:MAG TPA: hypothetical protein VFA49_06335 [Chloroflexota bacterium]|nr:hypothetical protein [Chloroflexota bacterium]
MHSKLLTSPARWVLLGVSATLILSAAAVGVAGAQQTATPTGTSPGQTTQPARPGYQQFIDALARRLGVTSDRLNQAISDARTDVGLPADRGGFGFPGGPGGRRGPGGPGPRGFGAEFSVAAQAIGITTDQLRQELPGKSLAQVAQSHSKDPADVATALKNAANQRIDQAVAGGRLTTDRANQLKQDLAQRIDQRINQVVPQGGPGRP